MSTILEELRKTQMLNEIRYEDGSDHTAGHYESDQDRKMKLTGVYRCRACGYIFDESLEGKPFSTLTECPLCHVSPGGFMRLR